MKLLSFITSLSLDKGGPSRSVPMMTKGLSEAGVDVTLMTFRSDDLNIHSLEGTGVNLELINDGLNSGEIENLFEEEHYDLVQMQSLWDLEYRKVARICRRRHIPYIMTPRGMLEPWSLSQKKWKKKAAMALYQRRDLNQAACIYTTSVLEADHIRKIGIKAPCSIIPNGIDTSNYPCRQDTSIVKKQVLFLSRIHPKKGIEVLLAAWKRIIDAHPGWSLLIVGNGEEGYIQSLEERVKGLSLSDSVRISPPVFGEEKITLYQRSSLFVLPSYSENFGMVIAEAMSCGVPIITTDNTPWELLNETNTGWCISLSEDNLVKTLDKALSLDAHTLYHMGQKGSKEAYERFDYHSVAKKNVELYSWILEGGTPPSFVKK